MSVNTPFKNSPFVVRCPQCGVLVSNLLKHKLYRHDPTNKVIIAEHDLEVVR